MGAVAAAAAAAPVAASGVDPAAAAAAEDVDDIPAAANGLRTNSGWEARALPMCLGCPTGPGLACTTAAAACQPHLPAAAAAAAELHPVPGLSSS